MLTVSTDREEFIDSNGVRIWTCARGQGVPFILCAGGAGCCDYLEPVAEMIDEYATVIRWEDRGCGRSECPPPYSVAASVAAMEDIRRHYGFERWVVGGHSWGSDLALAYALAYPQRTIALTGIAGGVVHRDQSWSEQYHRLKAATPEYLPTFKYPPNLTVNEQMSASWREYVREPHILRAIAELIIPSLYIWGEKDIRPHWPVEQLASLLPRGRFVVIKDAPHLIWHTHSDELKRELREFLQTISEVIAISRP